MHRCITLLGRLPCDSFVSHRHVGSQKKCSAHKCLPAGMWSPVTDLQAYTGLILGSWLNILLFAIPLGWAGQWQLSCMTCRVLSTSSSHCSPSCCPLQLTLPISRRWPLLSLT